MTTSTSPGATLTPLTVHTINTAAQAKGSIHDDEKAREMGYAGGFVPGVTVLAYMTRLMHEAFGADWLAGGTFKGHLRRPTYAGVEVTVEGDVVEAPSAENGGRVAVELRVRDPEGTVTATGRATCRVRADA